MPNACTILEQCLHVWKQIDATLPMLFMSSQSQQLKTNNKKRGRRVRCVPYINLENRTMASRGPFPTRLLDMPVLHSTNIIYFSFTSGNPTKLTRVPWDPLKSRHSPLCHLCWCLETICESIDSWHKGVLGLLATLHVALLPNKKITSVQRSLFVFSLCMVP